MADNFKLTIGMTTQQVMSNISRMNATDKTKQMIINFCNNDEDKKISNEIELAMLDSWANGSEKVKMPNANGMKEIPLIDDNSPLGYDIMGTDGKDNKLFRASKNRLFGNFFKR